MTCINCPRADALQMQLDELQSRYDALTESLEAVAVPVVANLTHKETVLCQLLRKRSPEVLSKETLMATLYAFRAGDEIPEIKIVAAKTPNGGYCRKDLEALGVPWPPPQGWKAALIQHAGDTA